MLRYIHENPASRALARAQEAGIRDMRLDMVEEAAARQRWRDRLDMDQIERGRNLDAAIREAYRTSWDEGMPAAPPESPAAPTGGGRLPAAIAGALAPAMPAAPSGMGPSAAAPASTPTVADAGGPGVDPVMQALAGVEGGAQALMQREGVVSRQQAQQQDRLDQGIELVVNAIAEGNDHKADAFARHFGLADANGNWHPKIAPLRGRPGAAAGIAMAKDLGYEGPQVGIFTQAYEQNGGNVAAAMDAAGAPYAPHLIQGYVDGKPGTYAVDPHHGVASPITVPPDHMGAGAPLKVMPKGEELTAVQQSRNRQIAVAREILESQGWLNNIDGLRSKIIKGIDTWSMQEEYDPRLRELVDLATQRLYGEDPDYEARWAALGLPEGPNAAPALPPPAPAPVEEDTGPNFLERSEDWLWRNMGEPLHDFFDFSSDEEGGGAPTAGAPAMPAAPAQGSPATGASAPGDEAAQLQQQVRDASIEGTPIVTMTWEEMRPLIAMSPEQLRARFTDPQLRALGARMEQLAAEQRAGRGQPLPASP